MKVTGSIDTNEIGRVLIVPVSQQRRAKPYTVEVSQEYNKTTALNPSLYLPIILIVSA